MPSNYFNVPTYNATSSVNPYAVNLTPQPIPGQSDASAVLNPEYGAMTNMPNYAQRTRLYNQLGTGPGSIAERYAGLMQSRQTRAASALRGYGGISFRADDPTTKENESLSPVYEADQTGQNERDAVKAATSQAASRGIVYSSGGEQLIGSALQRVSNEARQVVDQYSSDLNQLATNQLQESQSVLSNYSSLYGADAATMLETASTAPAKEPTIQRFDTKPAVDTNRYNVVKGGDGAYYTIRIEDFPTPAGVYSKPPNRKALDTRFMGGMNYVVVKRPDGKWEVRTK